MTSTAAAPFDKPRGTFLGSLPAGSPIEGRAKQCHPEPVEGCACRRREKTGRLNGGRFFLFEDALDSGVDAVVAFVAGLEVAEFVVAIEQVERRDRRVLEAVDDRVLVIDRARLRDPELGCRGRHSSDVEFRWAARLMDRRSPRARAGRTYRARARLDP